MTERGAEAQSQEREKNSAAAKVFFPPSPETEPLPPMSGNLAFSDFPPTALQGQRGRSTVSGEGGKQKLGGRRGFFFPLLRLSLCPQCPETELLVISPPLPCKDRGGEAQSQERGEKKKWRPQRFFFPSPETEPLTPMSNVPASVPKNPSGRPAR